MKSFLLFILFFLFNISEIDSNNDKKLIYNSNNLYDKEVHNIYFKSFNSKELNNLNKYNIEILSYLIDDKKYYARNEEKLYDEFTKDMSLEEKTYYKINGINIDGISAFCENRVLNSIEKNFNIY